MKYILKTKRISKKDFYNLDEDNLMFITNPGRMGDEDGSTFVIKTGDSYIPYRIDDMSSSYKQENDSDNYISIDDMYNVFPKWKESWHNYSKDAKNDGKYVYIYMGFGNGLCVDKRVYEEYYEYLMEEIKNTGASLDENGQYDPGLYYSLWDQALIKMILNEMDAKKDTDLEFYKAQKELWKQAFLKEE